ncbi:phage holin family protein [Altererythrobacter salegens]|uniref:Phage holin family protein n=1 Tax=Croceibacterium salegens TaxID=1737568 RepID=A0A6I4SVG5_9SPHN|nr:phage holin family protein [Croceibacterium salegens]MXO58806.1 phage holin family protein [Croceibacterium salegens]
MDSGEDDRLSPLPGGAESHDAIADAEERAAARSLLDDIETLVEDGKTYLEAEARFQKSRAIFVIDGVRSTVIFGAIAGAFGFIALIGLTVGLIIALMPHLTVWGSSALVVGAEFFLAVAFGRMAEKRWNRIMDALDKDRTE